MSKPADDALTALAPASSRHLPRPSLRRERVASDGSIEIFIGLRRPIDDDGTLVELRDRRERATVHSAVETDIDA